MIQNPYAHWAAADWQAAEQRRLRAREQHRREMARYALWLRRRAEPRKEKP